MPEIRQILILPVARAELVRIAKYTRQRWGKARRDRYLDAIDKAILLLAVTPLIGEARDDLAPGVRLFASGRHFIAYRLRPGQLQVLGFPHQSMDLRGYFED